jgi:hypothetical protein
MKTKKYQISTQIPACHASWKGILRESWLIPWAGSGKMFLRKEC